MPAKPSANGEAHSTPLPRPPKQRKFGTGRKGGRARSKAALPDLTESQKTLTQMPSFMKPSSSSNNDQLADAASGSDSSVLEVGDERPKKRRRRKNEEREAGQPTYTQFHRIMSTKIAKSIELDSQGWQMWEDGDTESPLEIVKQSPAVLEIGCTNGMQDHDDDVVAVKAQSDDQSLSRSSTGNVTAQQASVPARRTRLTRTPPHKAKFTEVPSSQSPASVKLSTRGSTHSVRLHDVNRSPLKEKSGNRQDLSPSQKPNLESQNVGMKMLERVRFAALRKRKGGGHQYHQPFSPERAPPYADAEAKLPPQGRDGSPVRGWRRVSTVHNSELEDLDCDDVDAITSLPRDREDDIEAYYAAEASNDLDHDQATFDPAHSALDRDAVRYGWWTQTTQKPEGTDIHTLLHEFEDCDDMDGISDEAVEREQANHHQSSSQEQAPSLPPPPQQHQQHIKVESSREPDDELHVYSSQSERQPSRDQVGHATHHTPATVSALRKPLSSIPGDPTEDDTLVPSSPPFLHPSQISTVVPTQSSTHHESPTCSKEEDSPLPSPPKSLISLPAPSLSSPGLPLPLMSSPQFSLDLLRQWPRQTDCMGEQVDRELQFSSLSDLSLPPPPSVSSGGFAGGSSGGHPPSTT